MPATRSLAAAGLVLGLGLGGFVDGIVAHQLLEWHHLLSGWRPHDLRANMLGDGLFHLACLLIVLAGVFLLARSDPAAGPGRTRRLSGWMLAGWGWFNLVEGLVDHHLLGLHHVRPGPDQLAYDLSFLALGLALVAGGTLLAAASPRRRG